MGVMPSPSSLTPKLAFAIAFSFSLAFSSSSHTPLPILLKFPTNLSLKSFSSRSSPSPHLSTSSQNIAADLLSLFGNRKDAARIPQDEARQLRSCLRFLVPPVSDSLKRRQKISEQLRRRELVEENNVVWWPPTPVMELARLAVDSGGDPATIQRALDLKKLLHLIEENGKYWYKPDVIIGDLDSVSTKVKDFYSDLGVKIVRVTEQEFPDLHKCVAFICDCTPTLEKSNLHILVAGALGGRFDHEMGNINVLYHFSNMRIIRLSDHCLIYLLPKTHRHEIYIQSSVEGPRCGLIPFGAPASSITTTGLQWDLTEGSMHFFGLVSTSNSVREEKITVHSDSDLLSTISIRKSR